MGCCRSRLYIFYDFFYQHITMIKYQLLSMLKVQSTVKIRGTRVLQKAIVPVGGPRPYSIIILNMRFIPKASLRASSQITASSYILERHLRVNNSKPLAFAPRLLGRWLTNKLTVLLRGFGNCLTPKLVLSPSKHKTQRRWADIV